MDLEAIKQRLWNGVSSESQQDVADLVAEVERYESENRQLRHQLSRETLTYEASYHRNRADSLVLEVRSVLEQMDELAEQWGDEAVFRRCRDRLRRVSEGAVCAQCGKFCPDDRARTCDDCFGG